jgi:hypothetical protein
MKPQELNHALVALNLALDSWLDSAPTAPCQESLIERAYQYGKRFTTKEHLKEIADKLELNNQTLPDLFEPHRGN